VAGAARTKRRKAQDETTEDSASQSDTKQQSANDEGEKTNQTKDAKTNDESQAASETADARSERQARREQRAAEDETATDESAQGNSRRVSRRQDANSDAEASSQSGDDASARGNNRRSRELEQTSNRDDEPGVDATVGEASVLDPVARTNPNVALTGAFDGIDAFDAGLLGESNTGVVASTGGGFAFARSGNIIAISGPNGARIINTDDPDFAGLLDDEPSDDGGNNDMDFTS